MQRDTHETPDVELRVLARRCALAARVLAVPAGIFAALSFGLPMMLLASFNGTEPLLFGISALGFVMLVIFRLRRSKRREPREQRREPELYPSDIEGLFDLGDFLIGELERGRDRSFRRHLIHFFIAALDRLTPDQRAELERRGADLTRLRAGLYSNDRLRDPAAERRTLYFALRRFVAAGRRPNTTVAYRSPSSADASHSVESGIEAQIRWSLRARLIETDSRARIQKRGDSAP